MFVNYYNGNGEKQGEIRKDQIISMHMYRNKINVNNGARIFETSLREVQLQSGIRVWIETADSYTLDDYAIVPNTSQIRAIEDLRKWQDSKQAFQELPIIAWRIDGEGSEYVHPIIPGHTVTRESGIWLLYPNGNMWNPATDEAWTFEEAFGSAPAE